MKYLDSIEHFAANQPNAPAVRTSMGGHMTYGELWAASEAIACLLARDGSSSPVVVYGHKDPLMAASFIACMKAGRPYVPVDRYSVPQARVASIIGQLETPTVLAVDHFSPKEADGARIINRLELDVAQTMGGQSDRDSWIAGEDLCYILFTSGSTGAPKGVEITASCFDNFTAWARGLGGEYREGRVYLDQAPFSFDLSVFELACALSSGGSLFSLEHETQQSLRATFEALRASGVNVWVSTPSFADLCLASEDFDDQVMLALETFLFCGETLSVRTAQRLMQRFPACGVVNTYGPTESTVAVTQVVVTPQMVASGSPLPVGAPRPGTRLRVVDPRGRELGAMQPGEVVIEGDTVARGYHGRPDLTQRAFGASMMDGRAVRTYRTGDEGYLDQDGMLHYRGRLDLQVKLNGFRIELGEIEQHLRRLSQVTSAAVVPVMHGDKVAHLVAHLVVEGELGVSEFRAGLAMKEALKETLPHYMVPKKIMFHSSLPMTGNGKVDRRALAASSK